MYDDVRRGAARAGPVVPAGMLRVVLKGEAGEKALLLQTKHTFHLFIGSRVEP